MASCPKCGKQVKVYQMSPYCKGCGVHLMFASFEGQFEKDRREAEMSMAFFRYTLTKLKSSYISSVALKFRIFAVFFPLIAIFIPSGALAINTPIYSSELSFNVLGLVYGPFMGNGLFGKLDAFSSGPVFGEVASSLKPLILVYAVAAVCAVLILLLELLSFIGNKKVNIGIMIFSVAGFISSLLTRIVGASLVEACEKTGTLAFSSFNIMFLVSAFLFIVPFVAAVMCLKNPPVYKFREGDELRVEYRRKYKKGEIKLMEIPAPIYESEEEKEEKRKLISKAYNISDENEEVTVNG